MNQKRKTALENLFVRWALLSIIAVLTISGIYHFDKFHSTRVFGPLVSLWLINDEIVNNKELEAKYAGYTDTTRYSDRIRELTKERQDNFYNSEDNVVAYISTRPAIVKLGIGLLSFLLMILVTIVPLVILFFMYYDRWDTFKKKWNNSGESKTINHVDHNEFQKFQRRSRVNFR